jgi:hypothetical protein
VSAPVSLPRSRRRGLGALGLGLAILAAGAGSAQEAQDAPSAASPRRAIADAQSIGATLLETFQVSGVRDANGVVTVVVCTNFSNAPIDLTVTIDDFDGSADCDLALPGLAAQETATFATRDTPLYTEDRICAPAPGTDGGHAVVWANGRRHALACTVQTVATGANGVRSINRLPLYTSENALVRDRLFTDGFESGDAARWSSIEQLGGDQLAQHAGSALATTAWVGCRLPLRERTL